jgi:putative flippase GtrA
MSPENPSGTGPWPNRRWAGLTAVLCLVLAATGLLRSHITGSSLFLGNYDRLGYFLAARLSERDALRANGAVSSWDERMFMGFSSSSLPGATSPLSPMRLVTEFSSRADFYYWAGICVVALLALAAVSAYACLRKFGLGIFAAVTGALVYMCSTHSMIRLAQADTSSILLSALPAGCWLLLDVRRPHAGRHIAALGGLTTFLFYSATGAPTIYLIGFWSALALFAAWQQRTLLPIIVCICGVILGGVTALPHLWGVGRELSGMVRDGGVEANFEAVYRFFNVRPHEILRAFDEGIFGRSPGEVAALGNNLNLSEGFQVYSSTFATLAICGVLLRHRGEWFRLFRMKDGVFSFCAYALVIVSAAVLFKPAAELTYLLFLRAKLIHARLSFIATLPAAVLAGYAVENWLAAPGPRAHGIRSLVLAALAAAAIWWGLQALGERPYAPASIEFGQGSWKTVSATFHLLLSGHATLAPAPPLPEVTDPVWLLSGRLVFLGCSAVLFTLLLGLRVLAKSQRLFAGQVLLALILIQTWREADQRWNGPENHSFPVPFANNNFFIGPAGILHPPDQARRVELNQALDSAHFRTVFIPEAGQFHHFVAPHLSSYWRLRTVEGYLSGVPERLAALAWPPGVAGFRTISFTTAQQLPWELLGILNVRQAVVADTPLYFDLPRPARSAARFEGSESLRAIPNPAPVLPREYFAARTIPAQPFGQRNRPVILNAQAALASPEVEGLPEPHAWSTEGTVVATYQGDHIRIETSAAAEPRFLVLNELYHPRWLASAAGHRLPIYPVNIVMRGIEIPAGVTQVDLEFRPYSRFPGWWAFPLGGTLILIGLFASPGSMRFPQKRPEVLDSNRTARLTRGITSPAAWRWGIVGVVATLLNLGLLYLLVDLVHLPLVLAPAVSAPVTISLRFLANDRWVFGFARPSWRRWIEYHVAVAGGFVAWWFASLVLAKAGLHYLLAATLAIGCSVTINALGSFAWVWRAKPSTPPLPQTGDGSGK